MFVLLHAYYSGALTMFFTSSPGLPFRTVEKGLNLYPSWDMAYVDGSEILFSNSAWKEPYSSWFKRIKKGKLVYDSMDSLMDAILKGDGKFLATEQPFIMDYMERKGIGPDGFVMLKLTGLLLDMLSKRNLFKLLSSM